MNHSTQNVTHNLIPMQLKWHYYNHAKPKIKIMKLHYLLVHKTYRKHSMSRGMKQNTTATLLSTAYVCHAYPSLYAALDVIPGSAQSCKALLSQGCSAFPVKMLRLPPNCNGLAKRAAIPYSSAPHINPEVSKW